MPYLDDAWYALDNQGQVAVFECERGRLPQDYALDPTAAVIEDLILDGLPPLTKIILDDQVRAFQRKWFADDARHQAQTDISTDLILDSFGPFAERGLWVYAAWAGSEDLPSPDYYRVCRPQEPVTAEKLPSSLRELLRRVPAFSISFSQTEFLCIDQFKGVGS